MIDCVGNDVHEGAILKVFHFVGSKKRKHFMYKKVGEIYNSNYRKIYHLSSNGYYLKKISDTLSDSVVVQCNCEYHIYNNLKISKFHGA